MQYTTARGVYAEIMDRTRDGKSLFQWQRLALLFFDEKGRPILGKGLWISEVSAELGGSPEMLYKAAKRCRLHGLPIITERPRGQTGEGRYALPKTEQQARHAVEQATADARGRVATQREIVSSLTDAFPQLSGLRPNVVTDATLMQIGGEVALRVAHQLTEGEGEPRALSAASA